ncbi:MAG: transglycosylase domain-containing protein [Lachnospirales bacterium]
MNFEKDSNEKKIKKSNSHKNKARTKTSIILFRIILALIFIIGFSLIGAGIGIYVGIVENAPDLESISVSPQVHTSIIYSDDTGEEIARLEAKENRIYVRLDELPEYVGLAAVAIEDERFYEHSGVDVKSLFRMVYQTIFADSKQGGSTITQQLIKNSLGITNNTIVTKLQEQFLAVQYEKELEEELGSKKAAKDYILELYLNTVSFGNGLNGVQTAANYYFEKDAKDLTISESAIIVSITQYPVANAPNTENGAENNYVRAKTTIDYMLDLGFISQSEYDEAYADLQGPAYARVQESRQVVEEQATSNSYFVDQIISELVVDLMEQGFSEAKSYDMIYNGGLEIYATIDLTAQSILDTAMLDDSLFNSSDYRVELTYGYSVKDTRSGDVEHFQKTALLRNNEECDTYIANTKAEYGENKEIINETISKIPQPQAAFTIIDHTTGEVIAISGGRGEKTTNRSLNRATQSVRQQGSVFKIVSAFLPAIDLAVATAATVLDDVPYEYDGGEFVNWYDGYRGLSTLREGVRDSMNIIAVKTMELVGVETSFDYMLNLGFTTLVEGEDRNGVYVTDKNLATALGGLTDGVSNIETTAAFAAMANKGLYNEPVFYTKVYNHEGKLIIDNLPEERRVIKEEAAWIITDMMYDVVYGGGTGTSAAFSNGMAVAGKTGTTTSKKDLAFYGYTPYLTGGVWMGYDNSTAMISSSEEHKRLWRKVMEEVHTALGYEVTSTFPTNSNLEVASVCQESGQLAGRLCSSDPRGSRVISEYFIKGTVPTTYCSVHEAVTIDSSNGKIANPYCPDYLRVSRIGIIRPDSYSGSGYVKDAQYEINQFNVCTVHSADYVEPTEEEEEETVGFAIDLDGDGIVDGIDTDGDGIIDVESGDMDNTDTGTDNQDGTDTGTDTDANANGDQSGGSNNIDNSNGTNAGANGSNTDNSGSVDTTPEPTPQTETQPPEEIPPYEESDGF